MPCCSLNNSTCKSAVHLKGLISIVFKHLWAKYSCGITGETWRSEEGNFYLSPGSFLPSSVFLWWCFMCDAYAAHLDTERKINALSAEQSESNSCFPESRIVQGKLENCSTGDGGWKGCNAINVGIFHPRRMQFKSSSRSPAGSLAYAHHRWVGSESHCWEKTLILV